MSKQTKLKYKIVSCSSQQKQHPVSNLLVKRSSGWESSRFCTYPQEITIQFYSQVHIKQLQFLSNSRKITTRIDILYYLKSDRVDTRFNKYAFLELSSNQQTNYQGRELKTIIVDIKCQYLRFLLHKNHPNKQNFFSQVGLHQINAIGQGSQIILREPSAGNISRNQLGEYEEKNSDQDQFIYAKLSILKQFKEKAVKEENYEEAKKYKDIISQIKNLGYKIKSLEDQKKIAIDSENYDQAQRLKIQIQKTRNSAEDVISQINNPIKKSIRQEKNIQKNQVVQQIQPNAISRVIKTHQNEFVQQQQDQQIINQGPIKKSQINHDQRVLPALLGNKKAVNENEDQDLKQQLPTQPEPLAAKYQKQAATFLTIFDESITRKFYSKHWQFRLQALNTFINEIKNPNKTKGKDINVIMKCYVIASAYSINEKVVQITQSSLMFLQQIINLNQKSKEIKLNELTSETQKILTNILKKLYDNNIKIKMHSQEVFKKMAGSSLFGVTLCSNSLIKTNPNIKISPKQHKTKLDNVTYFINLYGLGNNLVPLSSIDFAILQVQNQNAEVRNSAIDLLVAASLAGGEQRVKFSIQKLNPNMKEMISKKIQTAKSLKDISNQKSKDEKKNLGPVQNKKAKK